MVKVYKYDIVCKTKNKQCWRSLFLFLDYPKIVIEMKYTTYVLTYTKYNLNLKNKLIINILHHYILNFFHRYFIAISKIIRF